MLKIKDNIDLKELEKFGLKKRTKYYTNNQICVEPNSRYVLCCNVGYSAYGEFVPNKNMFNSQRLFIGNVLFDLIQAGLVEKVVEE